MSLSYSTSPLYTGTIKSFTTKKPLAFSPQPSGSNWERQEEASEGSPPVNYDIKRYDFAYINHGVQTAKAVSALDQLKMRYIKSRVESAAVTEHLKATLGTFVPDWFIWAEERPVEVLHALRMNHILPRNTTPPPIENTTIPKVGILFRILQKELEDDA